MLEGVVVDNTQLFNIRLQEWEHYYNFERPHGGLAGQTPYERLRERTQAPAVSVSRTVVDPRGFEPLTFRLPV